ncbi:hypothetical protein EDD18DRAFT_1468005 [Armillaria luteobubalina]|uniref:Uncharacterized protein n=1 Tax=Armillaria luteobubalina TaxID=153913 RepID=A0AA39UCV7_9AGAR|nr:hypothetical protein EDD18DRAFT_1468005 [Armillaria luteobubalina]
MLLSVPSEIQSKIAFEADHLTRGRLRRTCKLLNDVATPIVFGAVYIDLSWTQHSSSSLVFLQSLISGQKLARCIRRLTLFLPDRSKRNPSRFTTQARIKKREDRLHSFDTMFLEAIPSMVSMRSLFWRSNVDSGPSYAELMFERFGGLPLLSSLKIYSLGEWDIPWYPFRHIRDIKYWGDSDNEILDFLTYNPNIESIYIYVRSRHGNGSTKRQSILSIFRRWPSRTYSTVKTLTLCGGKYSRLCAHEIPTLVPHLRYLKNLYTGITTSIPDEFWDRLRKEEIHLTSLSHRQRGLERALLSYLVSFSGLRKLTLGIRGRSTPDDLQVSYLLANAIALHSWSLTKVHIRPSRSGPWCLDHPMLDALELCLSLQSLHVHADEAGTRVDADNVIDRTLQCVVTLWPNIQSLVIHAVSQSFGFDALQATASRIHKRILAFRFVPLPLERRAFLFSSNFARYSTKVLDEKNGTHVFKVEILKDWGRKDARRILRRKYKFWARHKDISDD